MPFYDVFRDESGERDLADAIERYGDRFWKELNWLGWGVAEDLFDQAYESGDDARAVRWVEEYAAPVHRYMHDIGEKHEIVDMDDWTRCVDRMDDVSDVPDFRVLPSDDQYRELYDAVMEEEAFLTYDRVVGVYSSGLPFLYTVSDLFNEDPVLVKYSHITDDDDTVTVTDLMDERAVFDGEDVLVVDDYVSSGETLEKVGSFVVGRGADRVDAVTIQCQRHYSGNEVSWWDEVENGVSRSETSREPVLDHRTIARLR